MGSCTLTDPVCVRTSSPEQWMTEVPTDLNGKGSTKCEGWYVFPRPQGKRCLVLASKYVAGVRRPWAVGRGVGALAVTPALNRALSQGEHDEPRQQRWPHGPVPVLLALWYVHAPCQQRP